MLSTCIAFQQFIQNNELGGGKGDTSCDLREIIGISKLPKIHLLKKIIEDKIADGKGVTQSMPLKNNHGFMSRKKNSP